MNNSTTSCDMSKRKGLEFDMSIGILNSFIPTARLSGFVRLSNFFSCGLDILVSRVKQPPVHNERLRK